MHRGQLLKRVVKSRKVKITELTKKVRVCRTTFYNHTKMQDLSFEQLQVYGQKMGYDFSRDIPEMSNYVLEPAAKYTLLPTTLEEAQKELMRLNEKCIEQAETIDLLRKMTRMLEEKLEGKDQKTN
jgi:hypothetical protein